MAASITHTKFNIFCLFFLFFHCFIAPSLQTTFPQNIQTFLPSTSPSPPTASPSSSSPSSPDTSRRTVIIAVLAAAAATAVVVGFVFFLCNKCMSARSRQQQTRTDAAVNTTTTAGAKSGFVRFDGNINGLVVDETGLDVLYWKRLQSNSSSSNGKRQSGFQREEVAADRGNNNSNGSNNGRRISFPRGRSSTSNDTRQVHPAPVMEKDQSMNAMMTSFQSVEKNGDQTTISAPSPRSPPPGDAVFEKNLLPAPSPTARPSAPPPPPPLLKSNPAPPPPPLQTRIIPKRAKGEKNEAQESMESNDQVKLKPLHWEKVNVNTEHSMVWNKIERGSFQYNGDMMEALFGYVATNRRSPKESSSSGNNEAAVGGSNQSAKTFILDSRRSQNIAIVLRSLSVPRNALIDGLIQGRGLNSGTLEKLSRIAPTVEEASRIIAFGGDPERLADAESFLHRLLKAVPSAFTRVDAMHFRSNYDHEILQLNQSLETVESACNELRSKGLFLKLLEAVLKAGNRLNAGTSRGNAKAFNLTTLLKLSDYKSTDGKTTLLHFVVHGVVRNEGKRCMDNSLTRSGRSTVITSTVPKPEDSASIEEMEFIKLGLPVVGGLSAELSNVKKAATVDYDNLASTIGSLQSRLSQVRQLVMEEDSSDGGGFVKEMKGFLEAAEGELKGLKEEQGRVMGIVKRTIQYYQSGASKDGVSFQLFAIVKDFLSMVDQACVDISRGLQQRKPAGTGDAASQSSNPDALLTRVTFPRLPEHFVR